LEIALTKKEEDALSQLKAEEKSASDEVRSLVINVSTDITANVISGALKSDVLDKALKSSLHELPDYLHKIAV